MVEYVSEDGLVWRHEEDAKRHGIVYRIRQVFGASAPARQPPQPEEKMSAGEEAALELLLKRQESPPQTEGKRPWRDRLDPAAPASLKEPEE